MPAWKIVLFAIGSFFCLVFIGCGAGVTASNLTQAGSPPSGSASNSSSAGSTSSSSGSGSVPSPVQPSQFLYVGADKMTTDPCCGSTYQSTLQAFKIDVQSGAISHVGSIQSDPNQAALVRSPFDISFYAAGAHQEEALGYRVDPTTGIPQVASVQSHFRTGMGTAISPDGKFVYVTNANIDILAADRGNLTLLGQFTPDSTPSTQNDRFQEAITSPAGKFLFGLALQGTQGDHQLVSFKVMPDGGLTPTSAQDLGLTGIGNKGWSVENSGNYFYAFVGSDSSIRTFRIDQGSGSLIEVPHSPQNTSLPTAGYIAVSPRNVMYIAARSVLAAYSVDTSSGTIALLGTIASALNPSDLSLDRSGRFLYVIDGSSASIFAYSIDAGGIPHSVAGSPFAVNIDSGAHLTAVLAD